MTGAPVVIVGAGPAGLAVARAYRAAGGRERVVLVGDEPHPPYRRPPLTKDYLRTGTDRDGLALEAPCWFAAQAVEHVCDRVVALDRDGGRVELEAGRPLAYGALVLATGSAASRPPLPGVDDERVLTLRGLDDADAVRARVAAGARRVIVVGAGFIGCEAAVSLAAMGCEVCVVAPEAEPQVTRLGEAAGRRVAGWLRDAGITLRLGASVAALVPAADGLGVQTADERPDLLADLVVLGAGATPRVELARDAGLALDDGGAAVLVDAQLRSSDPRIWAAGDLARVDHPVAGRPLRVEHWGDALGHGDAVGRTLAGTPTAWEGVPGFWSSLGERTLKLVAWGDGFDRDHLVEHTGGGFTVYYERAGACVGVLTHEADDDHDRAAGLVARGAPVPFG